MPKVLLHHVSYPVRDVEESASFYENLFNLERLDRPPFSIPGVWLACHDRQIHLVLNEVLSDEFELVSVRPVRLSFIPRQVRATRPERRCVSA